MSLFNDPGMQLELYHQRAREEQQAAAAYRLAREASTRGRHRHAWWPRFTRRPRPVRAPAAS
ncbi:hypothetical protein AB0J80_08545 [Actinoplanes sp. NPDC049548]|uniref:hypothetical protein n=1 Tax=Actinoplanes sp. NPDC049548 TaxID=3155152 RepID=UPI003414C9A5